MARRISDKTLCFNFIASKTGRIGELEGSFRCQGTWNFGHRHRERPSHVHCDLPEIMGVIGLAKMIGASLAKEATGLLLRRDRHGSQCL